MPIFPTSLIHEVKCGLMIGYNPPPPPCGYGAHAGTSIRDSPSPYPAREHDPQSVPDSSPPEAGLQPPTTCQASSCGERLRLSDGDRRSCARPAGADTRADSGSGPPPD